MKVHQEFTVTQPVSAVWKFFDEPESVASCMPGVEEVTVLDPDNVQVRATQSVGPMTATFQTKITVLERVTEELIRFRAAGQSVRGAIGNMRLENTVRLHGTAEGTSVVVDGDLVLAGALGSVGQKVVARQAGKVTAEFAANLQRALSGEGPEPARPGTSREVPGVPPVQAGAVRTARWPGSPRASGPGAPAAPDRWGKAAVALSGVTAVLSVVILIRQRRGQ
jgi:carbon monoxide dehydrogenase subunit G